MDFDPPCLENAMEVDLAGKLRFRQQFQSPFGGTQVGSGRFRRGGGAIRATASSAFGVGHRAGWAFFVELTRLINLGYIEAV